jgi:hypothetical protein
MMTVKDLKAILDGLPDEAPVLQECHQLVSTFCSVKAIKINADPLGSSHVRMVRADSGEPALLIF